MFNNRRHAVRAAPLVKMSRTVSRVMSRIIIYLGLPLPAVSSNLPGTRRAAVWSLFGLASDGVYTAISVTGDAVSSYLAFSPLPLRAVIFCCTFLGVTSTGRYPASCPVKPGLSSPAAFRHMQLRLSVLLVIAHFTTRDGKSKVGMIKKKKLSAPYFYRTESFLSPPPKSS